jgi:hypothetical protein
VGLHKTTPTLYGRGCAKFEVIIGKIVRTLRRISPVYLGKLASVGVRSLKAGEILRKGTQNACGFQIVQFYPPPFPSKCIIQGNGKG